MFTLKDEVSAHGADSEAVAVWMLADSRCEQYLESLVTALATGLATACKLNCISTKMRHPETSSNSILLRFRSSSATERYCEEEAGTIALVFEAALPVANVVALIRESLSLK